MNMPITIGCRDKNEAICRWNVTVTPEYTPADAIRDVMGELKESQNHAPRTVLVCIPGGKA